MRKHFYLLGLLLTSAVSTMAQTTKSLIKGKINDQKQIPVATASVLLHKVSDSSLVKASITSKEGVFEIQNIEKGNYFLKISMVGYSDYISASLAVAGDGKTLDIATVALSPISKELQNVVVTAKKPLLEVKADKTIFNIENSIAAQGSDALELLQKTPGVQVDNNENISMKGKTGVKIYVDGRMMQLDGKDLAAYLKSINSNDIEAIEMISNPSAKYDASGNAGIINIRLKKNKKYGTNGSVNLGLVQGITPKGNGSVNLNYRNKKVNVFGNVGGNIGMRVNNLNLYRIQKDTLYDQESINTNRNKSVNAKIGADYFANSKQTFGVLATVNYNDALWTASSTTPIYDYKTGTHKKTLVATNSIPGSRLNANFNANYRFADTSGRELTIDVDYGMFRGSGRSTQPNLYLHPDGSVATKVVYGNYTPTDINIFTAKIDREQPAFKGKLGYGGKVSYVTTDNSYNFYNYIQNVPVLDKNRSNSFSYIENVNAAYVNFNRLLSPKWSLQTGLRIEQTNSDGNLTRADGIKQDDDRVKRHYLDFFPSAAITWSLHKKHSLNLTYSRRIDRPTYQDLNPFENKLDELTYEKGNAFLQPQYTNSLELTHTFMGMINTTLGYSHVKDFSTQITDTIGNSTFVQQRNLANQQVLNFSIGSPIPVAKWWNGYLNLWYNYQIYDGTFNNGHVHTAFPTYGAYMQNTFSLTKKGLKAELTGWFNGPGVWAGTWKVNPMGNLDIAVQQPLFKNKGSLKLAMTDVFHTNHWTSKSEFGGLYIKGQGGFESQTFRVNFTWRLGSAEVKAARQHKTGIESEAGRIKGK